MLARKSAFGECTSSNRKVSLLDWFDGREWTILDKLVKIVLLGMVI